MLLVAFSSVALARLHIHNSSFVPDQILRVTAENITQGCLTRYSVAVNGQELPTALVAKVLILIFIIGTSPGPELRFQEGEKKWIRVYNGMSDKNLTMVMTFTLKDCIFFSLKHSIGMV
jgi:hypothetical protein